MNKTKRAHVHTMGFKFHDVRAETVFNEATQSLEYVIKKDDSISHHLSLELGERQYMPPRQAARLAASGVLRLASTIQIYASTNSLRQRVQAFIHQYCDLPPAFELICTYYVLLTWRYDQFNELPYLRVRGDYGSGKTRFLNVVGGLAYNTIFASGASTTAPIFHLLDSIHGTLVLDESDYRYSDATVEIIKILNNGHAKGFSVLRCEPTKDGGFLARAYDVFGPKIVAARESFYDAALESRFVTCDLDSTHLRDDIPVSLPDHFESEAKALRNQLLWYRFHAEPADLSPRWNSDSLTPRSRQIYQPLMSLVDDSEHKETIEVFIGEQEAQLRSDRGLQSEAELLQVIQHLTQQPHPLSLAAVTKEFMIRYSQRYSRRITPKWIGYLLRSKLHLATRKSNGVYIISEGQTDRLAALYQKYDVV